MPELFARTLRCFYHLLGFYDRGLIKPAALERFARPIFGDDFHLERDPQPPLTAGTALSPGDQLKAETTLEATQLKADADREKTQLQGSVKDHELRVQGAQEKGRKPPAALKPPPEKKRFKGKMIRSIDSDDDDSSDSSDEDDPRPKKRKRESSKKDKPRKRARKGKD
jgi:hypothetical protein